MKCLYYILMIFMISSCTVYQKTSLSSLEHNDYKNTKIRITAEIQEDSIYLEEHYTFKRYYFEEDSLTGYYKKSRNHPYTKIAYKDIRHVQSKNKLLSDLGTIGIILGGAGITLGVITVITLSSVVSDQ